MQRHQFWILLGVALAFGMVLELMKGSTPSNERIAGFGQIHGILDEGQAVIVEDIDPNSAANALESRVRPARVAVNKIDLDDEDDENDDQDDKVATISGESGEQKTAPGAKADDKKKTDKKGDKKKDDKKKKKKKKATPTPTPTPTPAPSPSPAPSDDDKDKKKAEDVPNTVAVPTPVPAGQSGGDVTTGAREQIPRSAKEWETYLLASADISRVEKFIRYYKSGMVTADVFYTVLGVMLQDNRPEMKKLAVMALGATPSLRSFEFLVSVEHAPKNPAALATQVTTAISVYKKLQNLHFLSLVITKPAHDNATPAYEAIMLLQAAAQDYLGAGPTGVNPGNPGSLSTSNATSAPYFTDVLTALNASSKSWPDPNVSQAAAQAYASIAALLPAGSNANPGNPSPLSNGTVPRHGGVINGASSSRGGVTR